MTKYSFPVQTSRNKESTKNLQIKWSIFLKQTIIKKTVVIPQQTEILAFFILICNTTVCVRLVVYIEDAYYWTKNNLLEFQNCRTLIVNTVNTFGLIILLNTNVYYNNIFSKMAGKQKQVLIPVVPNSP